MVNNIRIIMESRIMIAPLLFFRFVAGGKCMVDAPATVQHHSVLEIMLPAIKYKIAYHQRPRFRQITRVVYVRLKDRRRPAGSLTVIETTTVLISVGLFVV